MLLTVITNCYKSTATLERTYNSLLKQTNKDFEWILVDDASPDDGKTERLIKHLAAIAPFPVKYYILEENHYGALSTYTACSLANGSYALILDHDDQLTPSAIEVMVNYIKKYQNLNDFVGVCGRCEDEKGRFIGKKFSTDEDLTTEFEIRFKQKNTSELFQVTRLDVLQDAFSRIKKGYTNGFCWVYICQKYKYLYVNDVFRIYDTTVPTSHSNNKSINKESIDGYLESLTYLVNYQAKYFKYNLFYCISMLYQLIVYSSKSKEGILYHIKKIKFPYNYLSIFIFPLYWFRRNRYQ